MKARDLLSLDLDDRQRESVVRQLGPAKRGRPRKPVAPPPERVRKPVHVVIEWPLIVVSEANMRGHWRNKADRAKDQRRAISLLCQIHSDVYHTQLPATITFTRFGSNELDDDNLAIAFKSVRDEIALQIGVDDRDKRYRWLYQQQRGDAGIRIEIVSGAKP